MRDLSCAISDRLMWVPVPVQPSGLWSLDDAEALRQVIEGLETQSIDAVILVAAQPGFPGGLPPDAYSDPAQLNQMRALTAAVEACPRPVIAALQGAVVNEGFELALAAHYRMAAPMTRFAMTQMALGLIPLAGGSQRLPRLCSARDALDILLNGRRFPASVAQERGIVDAVTSGDFLDEVQGFARRVVAQGLGPRPTGRIVAGVTDPARYQAQMEEARKAVAALPVRAAQSLVECVQAAQVLPIRNGLELEQSLFHDCETSAESRALRYLAGAEQAARGPVARTLPQQAMVLGHSAAAVGMAQRMLEAGIAVRAPQDFPELREKLAAAYDLAVKQGQISPAQRSRRLALLLADAGPADLMVDDGTRPQSELSSALTEPKPLVLWLGPPEAAPADGPTVALRQTKPAQTARVAEAQLLHGDPDDVRARAGGLFRALGLLTVWTRGAGVADHLLSAYWQAAEALVLMGADPKLVDQAMLDQGFPIGPLAQRDALGLDQPDPEGRFPVAALLCANGRSGRDAGLGFFRYLKNDPRPRPDGVILWTVASLREQRGIVPLTPSAEVIRALCLGALWAAGQRMVTAGQVVRASDIDVLAVQDLGFPRHLGGPMHAAQAMGKGALRQIMARYARIAPDIWTAPPELPQRDGDDHDHQPDDRQAQ